MMLVKLLTSWAKVMVTLGSTVEVDGVCVSFCWSEAFREREREREREGGREEGRDGGREREV